VVSTKNVESLNVTQGATRVASANEVLAKATGGAAERSEPVSTPAEGSKAPAKAPVKKTAAATAAPH